MKVPIEPLKDVEACIRKFLLDDALFTHFFKHILHDKGTTL
jgi:hypothetical protein